MTQQQIKQWLKRAEIARMADSYIGKDVSCDGSKTSFKTPLVKGRLVRVLSVKGNHVLVRPREFPNNDYMYWVHQDYLTLP